MSKISLKKLANSCQRFEDLAAGFQWDIPSNYNMGVDVSDRWAAQYPDRTAIIDIHADGSRHDFSFQDLSDRSNQLANALQSLGVGGRDSAEFPDRVAVLLPQCLETALTHIAVFKMGLISLPLFILFGPDALLHRLRDSATRVLVTNTEGVEKIASIRDQLPGLDIVINVDAPVGDELHFESLCRAQSQSFEVAQTKATDPALIIYTSGTTGNPKGALHAHQVSQP